MPQQPLLHTMSMLKPSTQLTFLLQPVCTAAAYPLMHSRMCTGLSHSCTQRQIITRACQKVSVQLTRIIISIRALDLAIEMLSLDWLARQFSFRSTFQSCGSIRLFTISLTNHRCPKAEKKMRIVKAKRYLQKSTSVSLESYRSKFLNRVQIEGRRC